MSAILVALSSGALGAVGGAVLVARGVTLGKRTEPAKPKPPRVETGRPAPGIQRDTSPPSAALRRDVQELVRTKEAEQDREILDRLLRDIRDLWNADEAMFWRWIEERQALVPSAWSTENETRPRFFDLTSWGSLVRWAAEEEKPQLGGLVEGAATVAVAPVRPDGTVIGVLTVSAVDGFPFDRDAARAWIDRFASQVASLIQLFELRREYGQHMRQSSALLDAVQRLHGHRTPETLAQALCETACSVTSATAAGVVRWNARQGVGVLQATSSDVGIDAGFHVTSDSLVGRVCSEGLPLTLTEAANETSEQCPYGGQRRPIGSLAVVPITSSDGVIGALVVEGKEPFDVAQHEARNAGLLAIAARGPLENVWEIEEVSRRARTDALTGLANRRYFDEQLRRVVAETDRFGGTCSLILVDLDHFKSINDTRGHSAGDLVLKHVAQLMSDGVRAVDLCARYGGEELAILLPQTSEQGAADLAERLRSALETRPVSYRGEHVRATASFGVSTYPSPVPYADWLVVAADKALYKAKAAGRNCVKVIQANHVTPALYKER